jgi:hypothetical protein
MYTNTYIHTYIGVFYTYISYSRTQEGTDIGIDIPKTEKIYSHFGFKPLLLMQKELIDE